MIDPAVFIAAPTNFRGLCLIYPPTVREVVTNPNFGVYQKILTITAEDIKDEAAKEKKEVVHTTSLEFVLGCSYNSIEFRTFAKKAFELFLHEPVTFCYEEKQIIIGDLGKEVQRVNKVEAIRVLDESSYFDFQNEIRTSLGLKPYTAPEAPPPDEDPRITAIKEKARQRDRIKARQKNKDGIQLSTCLAAICCMGIGITPLNIGELSYASIGVIMNMMQDKEKYDIDIRSLLAGESSKKVKPKYWIRNND